MTNYTSGHETRIKFLNEERLAFPHNHIETDNRISWFLGRLDRRYGNDAFYVHLTRDPEEVAKSYAKRIGNPQGVAFGYYNSILTRPKSADPVQVCLDYVDTVNSNISAFLRNKPNQIHVRLENAKDDFRNFWRAIGAEGNLDAALREWDTSYNQSRAPAAAPAAHALEPAIQEKSMPRSEIEKYWEDRKDQLYYQAVRVLTSHLGENAGSILDVGSAACPYLEWYPWIPTRTSIDLRNPYRSPEIRGIVADFLEWQPDQTYDIVTCLQVMEHVPDAGRFAQKLMEVGRTVVVSVPYKWRAGSNASHVHDPVEEGKMRSWFRRPANFSYIIREVLSDSRRLIQVYERDNEDKWPSLRAWKRARNATQ
jgi:hypothetical protein